MKMRELSCAVCGSAEYAVKYPERIPPREALNFSARRNPQVLHARIVECTGCGLIYSNPYFDDDVLRPLYREAAYIDEQQLENMRNDYLAEFERAVGARGRDIRILEIGCANGFFIERLVGAGFHNVQGVEPGLAAVAQAPAAVRPHIIGDFFSPELFVPDSFDVVCCFQILDHIPQPHLFLQDVRRVLKPGGVFLTINHNIRSAITALLGERSPMYDIEHICLFDKRTIRRLFEGNGFEVERVAGLRNSYTLPYAAKMFPLPGALKRAMVQGLQGVPGLSSMTIRMSAGNMVAVGRKAAAA